MKMILLTTSHRPTGRIRTLCRDLAVSIRGLIRVNRGKMNLYEVAEKAIELGAEKIVVIDRWKGGPGGIKLFEITEKNMIQVSPTMYIHGINLRREIKAPRKPAHSLFIDKTDDANRETRRLKERLSNFFSIPTMNAKEASKYQMAMRFLTDSSSGLLRISFYMLPENIEIGPRITISHVVWKID